MSDSITQRFNTTNTILLWMSLVWWYYCLNTVGFWWLCLSALHDHCTGCNKPVIIRGGGMVLPCDIHMWLMLCKILFVLYMDKFTVEHQVFFYKFYVKCKFANKCNRKFRGNYLEFRFPTETVFKILSVK